MTSPGFLTLPVLHSNRDRLPDTWSLTLQKSRSETKQSLQGHFRACCHRWMHTSEKDVKRSEQWGKPWTSRGLEVKKPGAMTCVRRCKGLASVQDIHVPHVQQYLKCNRVSQGKNTNFISLLPLPVCFAVVNAICLSCLFRLI